ncbi:hypothetical protein C2845_PM16G17360 [Panicum miliaceum]|uniref:Uncharacterized protein n=1 Tax=Panicum miliaceum TaxID=4540 RepID=A0A3L6PX56_PANMI|nr:hypothetical protein C2845_PM16G17360 [Panicum miliaceum]
MKIAWGLPLGVESDTDEAEKEEEAVPNTNCPGTKPLETAELLQPQGDKLEVNLLSRDIDLNCVGNWVVESAVKKKLK